MDLKSLRWRWVARLSIVAALCCMSVNCLSNQLLTKLSQYPSSADAQSGASLSFTSKSISLAAAVVSSLMLIGGLSLGAAGIWAGLRRREFETMMIAALGFCLNLAVVGFAVWFLWVLASLKENAPSLDS